MASANAGLATAIFMAFVVTLPLPLAAGDIQTDGKLVSTLATGTPPLAVDSTTLVDNLNADLLDGLEASALVQKLARVVTVSPTGGDFTSIQAAIDSITDAAGANEYLVLVGPGQYNEMITMKPFVHVHGAGRGLTKLVGAGGDFIGLAGTVICANSTVLQDLDVFSFSGAAWAVGVYCGNGQKTLLRRVSVKATGGTTASIAVYNQGAGTLIVEDSDLTADGIGSPTNIGISNFEASLSVRRSDTVASGSVADVAILNDANSGSYNVVVSHSFLRTSSHIDARTVISDTGFNSHFEYTDLTGGGFTANGGTMSCAFVCDHLATARTDTCPP